MNRYTGTLAFIGEVHYTKGIYAGVVMDKPEAGKNKGIVPQEFAYVSTFNGHI